MGLFVLEDTHLEHVPGTATLDDLDEQNAGAQEHGVHGELKKSKNGTILVPQPSDDPNGMYKCCAIAKAICIASPFTRD